MQIVELDRRFIQWTNKEPPDPDFHRAWGLGEVGIGWDELVLKRRVVILAEAGSGKSTEMSERARRSAASGCRAFHATVEDVGRDGLERALGLVAREALTAWLTQHEEAWFFIDSIDEAKSSGVRLEKVARKLADGIRGAEDRAHIILSGRITDWEFRKDLNSLESWLPVSSKISAPAPTAEEELLRLVRLEGRQPKAPPPPETPFVAVMASLDQHRIRRFAAGKGTPNLELFLKAVDEEDLWHFARRPLDLDWLVRFWRGENRLGSLSEMIDRSIRERLKETNLDRARGETLDSATAFRGVERIAATMVLGKRATIAIPDGEVAFTSDSPLDLAEVLPEWPAENRLRLLSRPVFDPATLGRARFHNDNQGVVRGFLAAQWLVRLRGANLSTSTLLDLLFATSYGVDVIRPSLNETAAWLSLWDKDVANEVVRRGPMLLLIAGDPASLRPDTRRLALESLMQELANGAYEDPWFENDKLRRFAQPELDSVVISLWPQYKTSKEAAELLLRIAWLGALKGCADLAWDAVFDTTSDPVARVFAGRALLATGDAASRREYANRITTERATLPPSLVRDAIVELFPTAIGIRELLHILETTNAGDDHGGMGFRWEGPRLVQKMDAPADIETLLHGLLEQAGGRLKEMGHYPSDEREEAYFPAIAAAALRLLQVSPLEDAPDIAIDAILQICNGRHHSGDLRDEVDSALNELHRTSSRRRSAFWRVAKRLRRASVELPIDRMWQLNQYGYPSSLQVEDVESLLAEGLRGDDFDRRLAIDAALTIYRSERASTDLLNRIASAVAHDAVALEIFREQTAPPATSPELMKLEREHQRIVRENNAQRAKRDQSWIDFVRDLRQDPVRISMLRVSLVTGVSSDLMRLWHLLHLANSHSRYSIDNVVPLDRIVGAQIAQAVRAGLIAHWRRYVPQLRSGGRPDQHGTIGWFELMGLAGLSMEAISVNGWADQLSQSEGRQAAGYATLEINRFPPWLTELAKSKPDEVCAVLMEEIMHEVTLPELPHYMTLQHSCYADDEIVVLLTPPLLDELEAITQFPRRPLPHVLHVVVRGVNLGNRSRLSRIGLERFKKEADIDPAVHYLAAVFRIDSRAAMTALLARLSGLTSDDRTELTDRFLTATFGDFMSASMHAPDEVPGDVLEELVRLIFKTRPRRSGMQSASGVSQADSARSNVLGRFVKTPGAGTYYSLLRLQDDPDCPISGRKLRSLAEERAVQDSETAAWTPAEVAAFEQDHEMAPHTPKDLQSVVLRRIQDMQHDLLHGDFAQGRTVKVLDNETDVQNWVADRHRLKQGRSFSVEREPHVVDEKEPDVRIRAKATDASVAMEIKVAESWSLRELDDALEVQLCGRYLRASDGRYGILLLVHQKARPKGWEDKVTGEYLSFSQVVARLSARAVAIAGAAFDCPQAEVAVLDVSNR